MKYFAPTKLSENIRKTPEGYLLCLEVPIARTGDMVYIAGETPLKAGPDGKVIITRSEEEVFRPATMASFEGKSLTISHPEEFVGPDNWSELSKGIMQHIRRGEGELKDSLVCDVLVTDQIAIGMIETDGMRELSCGYDAEFVQTEPGKGYQQKILGNHLALVEQGRAGPAYAIKDSKPKEGKSMSVKEKIKAIFAKAGDEAAKVADEEGKEEPAKKTDDAISLDGIVKGIADLAAKVDALKSSDAQAPAKKDPPAPVKKADDEDPAPEAPAASGLEDRLKALEASVAKILEMLSDDSDGGEETGDEDGDDDEATDEDSEEVVQTGDSAARAEILVPGIAKTKDVAPKALRAFYATADGKKIIHQLNSGRAPAFDSAEKVNMLFMAASEVVKATRTNDLAKTKTKTRDFVSSLGVVEGAKTAEEINEINRKHFGLK